MKKKKQKTTNNNNKKKKKTRKKKERNNCHCHLFNCGGTNDNTFSNCIEKGERCYLLI